MSDVHRELLSLSPSDPRDEVGRFRVSGATEVSEAVGRARAAQREWDALT